MATGLENLWIYQLAEDLEIKVHEITKSFPKDELYRSIDQLRRSSSSVSNNIAEHYHKTTTKEKNRYCQWFRKLSYRTGDKCLWRIKHIKDGIQKNLPAFLFCFKFFNRIFCK